MKHALCLFLACCALVAQDVKPSAEDPKQPPQAKASEAPKTTSPEIASEAKPKIPPINVRDELIELIHQLKKDAAHSPRVSTPIEGQNFAAVTAHYAARYESDTRAKSEARRLLLQALIELSKLPAEQSPHHHSSSDPLIKVP